VFYLMKICVDVVFVLMFQDTAGPLRGVVIAVCKKLTKNQSEYNSIAASLGADYRWMYDNSCTHFIFQVCRTISCYFCTLLSICIRICLNIPVYMKM